MDGRASRGRLCARGALAVLLVPLLAACSGEGEESYERAVRGPAPVVLVIVDTLRADRLGVYGHDRPTSPTIDALGAEGLVFERALAQSTWTKPTTASILTGLYPSAHGVTQGTSTLGASLTTLAEVLGDAGHATAAFVANHFVANPVHGFQQGFERFEGHALEPAPGDVYVRGEVVVDRALAWLEAVQGPRGRAPFFLYVHLMDPHLPYDPPQPWRERFVRPYRGEVTGRFGSKLERGTAEDLGPDDRRHLLDLYDGEIAYADAQLARLFADLRARGLWDDALVILLADHGEEFGEHGGLQHGPGLFQEVVHVPLLVKPPSGRGFPAGERVGGVAMQVDVLPTVRDVLGLPPAVLAQPGTSLLARAMLPAGAVDDVAFGEVDQDNVLRTMAVEGSLKLVRQLSPRPLELAFDLAADPGEQDPEGLDRPLRARLRARLDAYAEAAPRQHGYSLVVVNEGGEPTELVVRIAAEAGPVEALAATALELGDHAGAGKDAFLGQTVANLEGQRVHVTEVLLRTSPGDRDGFSFGPAPGDGVLWLDVHRGGAPVSPGTVRLGAARTAPAALPVALREDDASLLAADPTRRTGTSAGGLRVHVWRRVGLRAEARAFDPEDLDALRGLGYFQGGSR